MRGDRHDVDSEIVLPAGMELVVPPVAGPATPAAAADQSGSEREASGDTQARRTDDASFEVRRGRSAA